MGRRRGPDWPRLVIQHAIPDAKAVESIIMLNNQTEFIPAVGKAFGALGKQHPKMFAAYGALEEASAEGVLDAEARELISIAVATTTHRDGYIGVHTEATLRAGASEAEIAQTLAAAISLNAGAAYVYSLRALETYGRFKK